MPCGTMRRSLRLKVFFLPPFACAFAINSVASGRWPVVSQLFLSWSFLLSHSHATRPFASARIGMRALTANRQSATMPQPAITPDVHQSLDVHLRLLAKVAFDHALLVNDRANAIDFVFAQLAYAFVNADACFFKNFVSARAPNAVDVCQTDFKIGRAH